MATTKEIKNRIKGVEDTQKITNAMYMISSTKMLKAKRELDATRPYFEMLKKQIVGMVSMTEDVQGAYFKKKKGDGDPDEGKKELKKSLENGELISTLGMIDTDPSDDVYAYLVITADKGLAGSYNMNVIKLAQALMEKQKHSKLLVVGEYGRHFFKAHNIEIEKSFLYTAQNPSLERAREITAEILGLYLRGEVSKVFVIYTDFKGGMLGGETVYTELIPFDRDFFLADGELTDLEKEEFTFLPDVGTVLNAIVPMYISGYIYSVLVDSFCSEQNARMSAMDAANQNAAEILEGLNLEYNHVRQGAITQEITEISAGSRGQKRNKKKKTERDQTEREEQE